MMVSYGHEGNRFYELSFMSLKYLTMSLVADRNDEFIELAESSMNMIKKIIMPGAFLVDIMPWRK